jgi:hypothetical protein
VPSLQPSAFGVLLIAAIVQYATKLAALQEARSLGLGPGRAQDKRLNRAHLTLHPAPNLDLLWGALEGLPTGLRRTVHVHRAATGVMALAGVIAFGAMLLG